MINKEFLRYLDIFGTKCSFYTDQKLKLYTPLGGILSITSFIAGIFIFLQVNLSSFKREMPSIITSSTVEEYHKIKFNNEKIWIPWKLSINNNSFNHSGVLFPIIKYYYKENNTQFDSKELSYKLCNETSMIQKPDNIIIDSSLDQLYCIDMDDLFMGGSFSSNFFYYVEFNLYICKDGINYDENNINCTSYDILNNLQMIFYYPTFEFQEIDFNSPIKIKYNKNCVFLSKYITKIDQLFLQKIILYDQRGLFSPKKQINSNWGFSSINKDLFFIQNKQNISTSKLYSFEIIIDSHTVNYYRSYKNIFFILAHCLPLINLVHNLLKLIAKSFKLSSINRKMTELLFENLTEKPNKYENYVEEISKKIKNNKNNEENNIINVTNKDNLKNVNNYSGLTLLKKKEKDNSNMIVLNKLTPGTPVLNHKTKTISEYDNNSLNVRFNTFHFKNILVYKNLALRYQEKSFPKKKRFIANKLFPFKYYFCSIFIKNIDLTKHRFCMSTKFIKVYCFLCQLFDISAYCVLQREFNIVKNSIFDEQNIKLIEQKSKINVNSQSFLRDMSDCIGSHKFNILAKNNIKHKKTKIKYRFPDSK